MSIKENKYKLQKMRGMLYNFARMLTSNSEDAYHLVQDTFTIAIDRDEDNADSKKGLLRIMRNLYIYNYKSAPRPRNNHDSSSVVYQSNGLTSNVDDIQTGISRLSSEQKTMYEMYISGYQVVEIAKELGTPVEKVHSYICQASKQLETYLKQCS